jgi:hypothetical protein
MGFLRQALVPDKDTVPHEYWWVRSLEFLLEVLGAADSLLHDHAYFTVMGVGDPASSPLTAVIVLEIAETVKCNVGLFLAAQFDSTFFSSHAKLIGVAESIIVRWFKMVRSLLYLTPWGKRCNL